MATPILLFPGWKQPIPSGNLSAVPGGFGLDQMLDAAGWSHFGVTRGPDGCDGQAICLQPGPNGKQSQPKVDLETQTWIKVRSWSDHDGIFYLGWEKDNPPTAMDLERNSMIDGWPVTLGDGNEWMIPVAAIVYTGGEAMWTLPNKFTRADDGRFVATPKKQYEELSKEAGEWFDKYRTQSDQVFDDVVRFCSKLIGMNYRVIPDLLVEAELIDTSNAEDIIVVAIGIRSVQEHKKKVEQASSASAT